MRLRRTSGKSRQAPAYPRNRGITRGGASYAANVRTRHHTGTDRTISFGDPRTHSHLSFTLPAWMFEPVSYIQFQNLAIDAPVKAPQALNAGPKVKAEKQDGLPVIKSADPLRAWKVAYLQVNDQGNGLRLRSVGTDWSITADQEATCLYHNHKAPKVGCSCGFYAYRTVGELHANGIISRYVAPGQVLLEVDLLGRVVESENLHRAARQRVMQVYLPGRCVNFGCSHPAQFAAFEVAHAMGKGIRTANPRSVATSVCGSCRDALSKMDDLGVIILTPVEMTGMLDGIPVGFATPDIGW